MKGKKLLLSLAIVSAIGVSIGSAAYAATENSTTAGNGIANRTYSGMGYGRVTNVRGYDIMTELLKSKGVTDEEINTARDSGKTLYTLLNEKGVTDQEIKDYMLNARLKAIDEAVASGKLTQEQGDDLKERIKENSANCTTPGQGNQGERGANGGNGTGQRMRIHQSN